MSEPQVRRFPFWLTFSVLGNLVLIGLLAGIFLNAPSKSGKDWRKDRPGAELTAEDREAVRELMRASFEAGREAMQVRRAAERNLADILKTEPYDETAARSALNELRAADRAAREIVADRMFEGLDELSPEQRTLVAKIMTGNLEKRAKRGERLEKWRERREQRREGAEPPR